MAQHGRSARETREQVERELRHERRRFKWIPRPHIKRAIRNALGFATMLFVILLLLLTIGVAGFHWYNEASPESSLRMTINDYRLALKCPTNYNVLLDFLGRPPSENDSARLADRLGNDWVELVCEQGVASLSLEKAGDTAVVDRQAGKKNPARDFQQCSQNDSQLDVDTFDPFREFMLTLINEERIEQGLDPVVLGNNPASQEHADEMLKEGYLSHWGLGGMKPYMRYTLSGGYNYEAENVSGSPFYIDPSLLARRNPEDMLVKSMEGLMNSPGHRRNILNKWHKKVNLGIAYNRGTAVVVQQFEGDYIDFCQLPALENGILFLEGTTSSGFSLSSVQIYYDPPPSPLTFGQLGATYCYSSGGPIAFLRPPPGPNAYYTKDQATVSTSGCIDPYSIDETTPRPRPVRVRTGFTTRLIPPPQAERTTSEVSFDVPWLDATQWDVSGNDFSIRANLSETVRKHGKGVYTVTVWGERQGEDTVISDYSIFVE